MDTAKAFKCYTLDNLNTLWHGADDYLKRPVRIKLRADVSRNLKIMINAEMNRRYDIEKGVD